MAPKSYLLEVILESLPKNKAYRLILMIVVLLFVVFSLFLLFQREQMKKDIAKRQLVIQQNRINSLNSEIAKVYREMYSNGATHNDTLLKLSVLRINFLNSEREDAIKKYSSITDDNSIDTLALSVVVVALLSVLLAFFFSTFRSNFERRGLERYDKSDYSNKQNARMIERQKNTNQKLYDFLTWITEEIAEKQLEGLDIVKAKTLKELYDFTNSMGEEKGKYLQLLMEFSNLEKIKAENHGDKYSEVYNVFDEIQDRLRDESTRLNRQAVINLFISFILAFLLTCVMFYNSILGFDIKGLTWSEFLMKFLPRLVSIVSIITFFLYFVRLYKGNLSDAKYYQNELTNIEQRIIALKTSTIKDDFETMKEVIRDLANVERNAFMSKEQTTVDLEKTKIENELNKDFLNKIWDVFGNFKVNSTEKKN